MAAISYSTTEPGNAQASSSSYPFRLPATTPLLGSANMCDMSVMAALQPNHLRDHAAVFKVDRRLTERWEERPQRGNSTPNPHIIQIGRRTPRNSLSYTFDGLK